MAIQLQLKTPNRKLKTSVLANFDVKRLSQSQKVLIPFDTVFLATGDDDRCSFNGMERYDEWTKDTMDVLNDDGKTTRRIVIERNSEGTQVSTTSEDLD